MYSLHDLDVIWDEIKADTFMLLKDEIAEKWYLRLELMSTEPPTVNRAMYMLELLDLLLSKELEVIDTVQAVAIKGFLDLVADGETYKNAYITVANRLKDGTIC